MKKLKKMFLLVLILTSVATSINAGCPGSCGGKDQPACNGLCVAVYGSDGKISYYFCSTGATTATKDCLASTGAGIQDVLAD
jgi:hypothetical protein